MDGIVASLTRWDPRRDVTILQTLLPLISKDARGDAEGTLTDRSPLIDNLSILIYRADFSSSMSFTLEFEFGPVLIYSQPPVYSFIIYTSLVREQISSLSLNLSPMTVSRSTLVQS